MVKPIEIESYSYFSGVFFFSSSFFTQTPPTRDIVSGVFFLPVEQLLTIA
jgi:hypothetical protein